MCEQLNNCKACGASIESARLLGEGLYVIEYRVRHEDKTLSPWKLRAAFVTREDAFSVYGKWHQREYARVLKPDFNNQENDKG